MRANFLHCHDNMPIGAHDHVVVDREDWEEAHHLLKDCLGHKNLAEQLFNLATSLWSKIVNTPGGHPGLMGPAGADDAPYWNETTAMLKSAINELSQVRDYASMIGGVTRTRDGAPILPGRKYFYIDPTGYVQGIDCVGMRFRDDSSMPSEVYPRQIFGTAKAASEASHGLG